MPTRLGEKPVTTDADYKRVGMLLVGLGLADTGDRHVLTIPGVPYSKSRPRFGGRGRAYAKPEDKTAEHRSSIYLRATVRRPYTSNVALACVFFRPSRQVVDTDNLLKHVCDAGNGVLWIDDQQCTALAGVLDLDRGDPRTVVAIGTHSSGLVRDLSIAKPKIPKGAIL